MSRVASNAETIFGAALSIESPDERAMYLERACRDDAALRAEVEALLADHAKVEHFLERPAIAVEDGMTVPVPLPERPGVVIGPYKLLQLIGEGGMGTVWMAEQKAPVERRVAVKVIKAGMDSQHVIARFEAEQQALALMDHPNIAKVLDAGTTPTGRPYFVMELVKGVPITQYCDERHLTLRERLDLFVPVCQAIQHAHQKGIIHRDIKPSNILIALYDSQPVPKVIDFGVAKATAQPLTEKTMFTEFGQVVGTLEYMSPEQAQLNQLDIDTRSDIYSLGVLLYELLTGSTPFDKKRLRNAAFDEMLRIIREEEPLKPSTRLSRGTNALPALAANRHVEPASLTKLVRGELDWIVMKALEKDRNRRYETANGLIRDLQRYLHDEPVEACPPSARYKLAKFARKHQRALATAGAFVLLLIAGVVVSIGLAVRARIAEADAVAERDKTAQAQAQAEAVTRFLTEDLLFQAAPEENAVGVMVEDVLRKAAKKIETNSKFADEPELEATLRLVIGNTLDKFGKPKEAGPHLRRAAELRRRTLGPDHPDTLTAQEDVAFFLSQNGDPEEAETLSRQTYEARSRVLGPEDPKTLESLDSLCGALVRLGRFSEAEPLHRKCIDGRQRVLGKKHKQTLQSMNNLGWALYEAGRHAKAEPVLSQCVQYSIESQGPKHPDTLAPRNNLSLVQLSLGKFTEAERTLRDAHAISRDVTGAKSAQTLHLQHVLVRILTGARKLAEAERIGRDTLAARREILTPGHPNIGRSLVVLSLALVFEEKYADAEMLLHEALDIFREQPNMDDWIAQADMSRGTALIGLGRVAEAKPLLAKAWPKYISDDRILPWQKQRTGETVAAVYEKAGESTEAAAWRAKLAPESAN